VLRINRSHLSSSYHYEELTISPSILLDAPRFESTGTLLAFAIVDEPSSFEAWMLIDSIELSQQLTGVLIQQLLTGAAYYN
jgi:hypothetical protein